MVETDAPGARQALQLVKGARELKIKGTGMRVYALNGATATSVDSRDRRAMTATWLVAGATLLIEDLTWEQSSAQSSPSPLE